MGQRNDKWNGAKTLMIALCSSGRHICRASHSSEVHRWDYKCDKTTTSLGNKYVVNVFYTYIWCLNLRFSGHTMEWSHECSSVYLHVQKYTGIETALLTSNNFTKVLTFSPRAGNSCQDLPYNQLIYWLFVWNVSVFSPLRYFLIKRKCTFHLHCVSLFDMIVCYYSSVNLDLFVWSGELNWN